MQVWRSLKGLLQTSVGNLNSNQQFHLRESKTTGFCVHPCKNMFLHSMSSFEMCKLRARLGINASIKEYATFKKLICTQISYFVCLWGKRHSKILGLQKTPKQTKKILICITVLRSTIIRVWDLHQHVSSHSFRHDGGRLWPEWGPLWEWRILPVQPPLQVYMHRWSHRLYPCFHPEACWSLRLCTTDQQHASWPSQWPEPKQAPAGHYLHVRCVFREWIHGEEPDCLAWNANCC